MNQKDPLELLGYIDDELIDEIRPCQTLKKRPLLLRYLAVAALIAALLTALTAIVFAFIKPSPAVTEPLPPEESILLPEDDLTGFTTTDGRVTIMMPHPERGFRAAQLSYNPGIFKKDGPWMRMFRNAYVFATEG